MKTEVQNQLVNKQRIEKNKASVLPTVINDHLIH